MIDLRIKKLCYAFKTISFIHIIKVFFSKQFFFTMQAFDEIATLVHKCQKKEEKEENILSVPPKMFKFQKAIKNYLYKEEFISPS